MDANKLLKKLEEIKEDVYNNLSSSEKNSKLQVESSTELPLEEDAKGEEVKIKRTKGEKYKLPDTLSRTTPMAGPTKHNPSEKVYVTDGTTKKSIQEKLDELKMIKAGDYFGHGRTELEESLLRTMERFAQTIEELENEVETDPSDAAKDELEHYKSELAKLEEIYDNINNPDFKLYKRLLKNDPMTQAKLLLQEEPKNENESQIFLLLQDAVNKNNPGQVQQVLTMLPQGM